MGAIFAEYWYFLTIFLILIGWLIVRLSGTNSNIEWKPLDSNLNWDSPPDESLTKIYDYVVAFSEATIQWYQSRRRPKRYLGVSLRVSALLATAFAGFIPLSKDLFNFEIHPAWSTVLIASAGVFVSIDVFGGLILPKFHRHPAKRVISEPEESYEKQRSNSHYHCKT